MSTWFTKAMWKIEDLGKDSHLHWNVEAANFFAITLVALPRPLLRVPRHPEMTHLLKLDCISDFSSSSCDANCYWTQNNCLSLTWPGEVIGRRGGILGHRYHSAPSGAVPSPLYRRHTRQPPLFSFLLSRDSQHLL